MKKTINCLREYATLTEAEKPTYLVKHGDFITTNASVFPDIPYDGATITSNGMTLFTLSARKDSSDEGRNAYNTQAKLCENMMEENYDYVDLIAKGNKDIVAKAGVKGSSANTSRTKPPSTPSNLRYLYVENKIPGEMKMAYKADKLAWGAVIVSFSDENVKVTNNENHQLKIKVGEVEVLVDISTTVRTVIKKLKQGDELNSVVALFNPNGLSPVASPASITVPR